MLHKQKSKIYLLALLLTLSSLALYSIYPGIKMAPDISFKTINNKQIQLNQLHGKVVLISFWASNCPSCLKEIPDLINLYREYHQRGLEIIAIAMYYDRPNYVVETSKNYQIPYDIVLDLGMDLATAFDNVALTPTTFLLSPQGEIIYQVTGSFDLQAMQTRIQTLLTQRIRIDCVSEAHHNLIPCWTSPGVEVNAL